MADKQKCIRCYFSGDRQATDEIVLKYGSTEYALDLCSKHSKEFDDLIWGWLRLAREVESPNFSTVFMSERLREAPAHVEPARPAPAAPKAAAAARETLPPVDVLALKWRLSEHAEERLTERGAIHGFSLKDVLRAAEAPEHSWPSKRGDGTWYRSRKNVGVLVNPEQSVIVTVLGPKEFYEATGSRTA